jgi:hypothetical protein
MLLYYMLGGAGALGAFIIVTMLGMLLHTSSQDYSLEVDAFKDRIDVGEIYRVIIANTGRNDISNITVDYGTYKESIPRLKVGEKVSLSPREDANKDYVTVTAEPNIHIVKEYRSAPKMPGMIGGMR